MEGSRHAAKVPGSFDMMQEQQAGAFSPAFSRALDVVRPQLGFPYDDGTGAMPWIPLRRPVEKCIACWKAHFGLADCAASTPAGHPVHRDHPDRMLDRVVRVDSPSCGLGVDRHAALVVRVDDRAVPCGDGGAGESQQRVLGT